MRLPMTEALEAIADCFHPRERITGIRSLGSGNVNETFLVTHEGRRESGAFVLQRLNRTVFARPDLVMGNLLALGEHVQRRLQSPPPELQGRRWEVPQVLPSRQGAAAWVEQDGEVWRSISYIGAATTTDVITDRRQAHEVGYGLGMFHSLISDLPVDALADTLEDFHVTPSYLRRFDALLREQTGLRPSAGLADAMAFVEERRNGVDVLEAAVERGELHQRPIHGDPKINNVMMDEATGQAVGLIDLDTVKPGLIHYDIGDCLRSCCNPVGEETCELDQVRFDLGLAESILEGYLSVAAGFLSEWDRAYLPDCIRLIPFELGLRFLTDHLDGDRYFRTAFPGHNLQRAQVQFRLTLSIESQMEQIRRLIDDLIGQA